MASSRETPCHKVDYWGWGAWLEAKESFKGNLVVVVERIKLGFAKDEGSKAAEQYWETNCLNCHKCNQCLKCQVSGHKCLGLIFESVL